MFIFLYFFLEYTKNEVTEIHLRFFLFDSVEQDLLHHSKTEVGFILKKNQIDVLIEYGVKLYFFHFLVLAFNCNNKIRLDSTSKAKLIFESFISKSQFHFK